MSGAASDAVGGTVLESVVVGVVVVVGVSSFFSSEEQPVMIKADNNAALNNVLKTVVDGLFSMMKSFRA